MHDRAPSWRKDHVKSHNTNTATCRWTSASNSPASTELALRYRDKCSSVANWFRWLQLNLNEKRNVTWHLWKQNDYWLNGCHPMNMSAGRKTWRISDSIPRELVQSQTRVLRIFLTKWSHVTSIRWHICFQKIALCAYCKFEKHVVWSFDTSRHWKVTCR
jgi:hypothetical protein